MQAQNPPPMMLFALASLAPLGLFGVGIWWGGLWLLAGLGYMTVLAALLDQISGLYLGDAPEGAEFPAADALLVALGLGSLALMPAAVWAIAGDSGLPIWGRAGCFWARVCGLARLPTRQRMS